LKRLLSFKGKALLDSFYTLFDTTSTDAVMRDVLHCADEEIATLKEQKVLY